MVETLPSSSTSPSHTKGTFHHTSWDTWSASCEWASDRHMLLLSRNHPCDTQGSCCYVPDTWPSTTRRTRRLHIHVPWHHEPLTCICSTEIFPHLDLGTTPHQNHLLALQFVPLPDVQLGSNLLQCLFRTLVLGRWQRNWEFSPDLKCGARVGWTRWIPMPQGAQGFGCISVEKKSPWRRPIEHRTGEEPMINSWLPGGKSKPSKLALTIRTLSPVCRSCWVPSETCGAGRSVGTTACHPLLVGRGVRFTGPS